MKQTTRAYTVWASRLLIMLLVAITSCSKPKDLPTPPSNGGGTGGGGVTPPAAPSLNAAFSLNRPRMGGADTCTYSTETGAIVTMNGSSEITSPLYFSNITAPISFQLKATKTVNGLTSAPTIRDMYTEPYSQDTTDRCASLDLKGYGVWYNSTAVVSYDNGVTWQPAALSSAKYTYYEDGRRILVNSGGLSHYQMYHYANGETWINLGETYNPPNMYLQVSLNANTMVLRQVVNGAIFVITWLKQ